MDFKVNTHFNPYLELSEKRFNAILTINAAIQATDRINANRIIGFILDSSLSVTQRDFECLKFSFREAIDLLDESCHFFVVSVANPTKTIVPLTKANPEARRQAKAVVSNIHNGGGTRISLSLQAALAEIEKLPNAIGEVILLTDGQNHPEDTPNLHHALANCHGRFRCEPRIIGQNYNVDLIKGIANSLSGTAKLVNPTGTLKDSLVSFIHAAQARSIEEVYLRLEMQRGVKVEVFKQMHPTLLPMTDKAIRYDNNIFDFPTGTWGNDYRAYLLTFNVVAENDSTEQEICTPSLIYSRNGESSTILGSTMRVVRTTQPALSTPLDQHVAHYTEQETLSINIRQGIDALRRHEFDDAIRLLGEAVRLAQESNNMERLANLQNLVTIENAAEGKIAIRAEVEDWHLNSAELLSDQTLRLTSEKN